MSKTIIFFFWGGGGVQTPLLPLECGLGRGLSRFNVLPKYSNSFIDFSVF